MDVSDLEFSDVAAIGAIVLFLVAVVAGGYYGYTHVIKVQMHEKECRENPTLLYAQRCSGYADCLKKCSRAQAGVA